MSAADTGVGLLRVAPLSEFSTRVSNSSSNAFAGTPIFAPGFGAQGAEPGDLGRLFGYVASQVVASESRSILSAGPAGLAARIDQRAALYRTA